MSSSTDSSVKSTSLQRTGPEDSGAQARPQHRPFLPASAALDRLETGHVPGVWTWTHNDLRFLAAGLLIGAGLLLTQWSMTSTLATAKVTVQRGKAEVPASSSAQDSSLSTAPRPAATALAIVALPDSRPSGLFRVEMNEADWVAWSQLDGIGEKLAQRIVADRVQHGPFQSIDDLLRVKGIGPKTLARLRPHLRLSTTSSSDGPSTSE